MKFIETPLAGAYVIELSPIRDERGYFTRVFCKDTFAQQGLVTDFKQENQSSCETKGILRGLHYQTQPSAETKLLRCVKGSVFDAFVDVRKGSPTFMHSFGVELNADELKMVYVPAGFAHGYQALTDGCVVSYRASATYDVKSERRVRYDDPRIAIDWPITPAILSPKDEQTPPLDSGFEGDVF